MTLGTLDSITATQELVVPRSIPMILNKAKPVSVFRAGFSSSESVSGACEKAPEKRALRGQRIGESARE